MSYLDFDGQRYWDVRYTPSYVPKALPPKERITPSQSTSMRRMLESDTTKRADAVALIAGDIDQA